MRLNWHVFGHTVLRNPEGLVTAALTRRMATPSIRTKAISDRGRHVDRERHCRRLKRGRRTADATVGSSRRLSTG